MRAPKDRPAPSKHGDRWISHRPLPCHDDRVSNCQVSRCTSRSAVSTRARSSSMRTIAITSDACFDKPSAITALLCTRLPHGQPLPSAGEAQRDRGALTRDRLVGPILRAGIQPPASALRCYGKGASNPVWFRRLQMVQRTHAPGPRAIRSSQHTCSTSRWGTTVTSAPMPIDNGWTPAPHPTTCSA